MPNWCYTTYIIEGHKEDLEKIHNAIEYLNSLKEPYTENDFGNLWLGCLIDYLSGIQGAYKDFYCRGEIIDCHINDDTLTIDTSTAWGEMSDFRKFLKGMFMDMHIYYLEDEGNMLVYNTNDIAKKYFKYDWTVDSDKFDDDFETFKEMSERIKEEYGFPIYEKTYEEAIENFCDNSDDDTYINIRQLKRFSD